jgi:gluconokinase
MGGIWMLAARSNHDFVVVMGVCGVGKSTIAARLAADFGGQLLDADKYHSIENIHRMSSGIPLSDDLRLPWLAHVCAAANDMYSVTRQCVFIACSALKRRYRDVLRHELRDVAFVHLTGSYQLIEERMQMRENHFMPTAMLDSQIADLEALAGEEVGFAIDISLSEQRIAEIAGQQLRMKANQPQREPT